MVTLIQWRNYIEAFRAHALSNSLSALPLSAIILAESGKRLIVSLVYWSVPYWYPITCLILVATLLPLYIII